MEKTEKMMKGIFVAVLGASMVGCSSTTSLDVPQDVFPDGEDCDEWEWDEDAGVYACDDSSSSYYRSYFYGGRYYSSKSLLDKEGNYQTYKSSYSKTSVPKHVSTGTTSGFGTGVKSSFGG